MGMDHVRRHLGLSGAGVAYQFLWGERSRLVSTLGTSRRLANGVAARPLVAAVPEGALLLLLAGGLCYSVSVVFHRWHPQRYRHVFWHRSSWGECLPYSRVLLFLLPHP